MLNVPIENAMASAPRGGTKALIISKTIMMNHIAFKEPNKCLKEICEIISKTKVNKAKRPPMRKVNSQVEYEIKTATIKAMRQKILFLGSILWRKVLYGVYLPKVMLFIFLTSL